MPTTGDPSQTVINRNYLTSDNVRARFGLYRYAEWPIDIEGLVIDGLGLQDSNKDIVDIGTSDGNLLYRLRWECGETGSLTGIDPNSSQFQRYEGMQSPDEIHLVLNANLNNMKKNREDYVNIVPSTVSSKVRPCLTDFLAILVPNFKNTFSPFFVFSRLLANSLTIFT